MDGNMYNVLSGLHRQLRDCRCVGPGGEMCSGCTAVMAALAELEAVPDWRAMSEAMERQHLEVEA